MATPKPNVPDVLAFVFPEKLTDGSIVYNVKVGNLVLHAVTEDDAKELAEGLVQLIDDHTNDTADVIYE